MQYKSVCTREVRPPWNLSNAALQSFCSFDFGAGMQELEIFRSENEIEAAYQFACSVIVSVTCNAGEKLVFDRPSTTEL